MAPLKFGENFFLHFLATFISKNQKIFKIRPRKLPIEKSIIFEIKRFYRLLARYFFFKGEIEKNGLRHFSAA